jgi:spore maturation protein CgeB
MGSLNTQAGADRLLVVGNPEPIHVGAHLLQAARALGLSVDLYNSNKAFAASWPLAKLNWWLRGHRPSRLCDFSRQVVELCQKLQPKWMVSTGISPIADWAIEAIGKLGTRRFNFLTDDPWNPAHRALWFMYALPLYDHIFSPRRANLGDLRRLGRRQVSYLPFAYAPEAHFAEPPVAATTPIETGWPVCYFRQIERHETQDRHCCAWPFPCL